MVLQNLNFWAFYLFKRGVTVGPVPARHSEKLFVWDFISGLSADLWSRSPSLKGLLARSVQFSTGTNFLSLSSAAVSTQPSHRQTFIGRFRRNMDSSQNAYNEDTSALVERLDTLEKALFRSGQSGLNSFQSWEKGQASQITASALVLNYRKRKITDMQQWYRRWQGHLYCTNTDSKGRRKCLSLRGTACVERRDSLS